MSTPYPNAVECPHEAEDLEQPEDNHNDNHYLDYPFYCRVKRQISVYQPKDDPNHTQDDDDADKRHCTPPTV